MGENQTLGDLRVNSSGITTFGSTINATSFRSDAGGTTQLNGDVTTTTAGGQYYSDKVIAVGNISLTSDAIDFEDTVSGTGNLIVQPFTPNQAIAIGGSSDRGAGTLDLTRRDLNALANGFSSITLGRADGSGKITLAGDTTFNDPVTLRSPVGSGSIDTRGYTLSGADNATITLLANQEITTGNILNQGRDITVTSTDGSIDTSAGILNSSSNTGNGGAIALRANNDITTGNINTQSNQGSGGNLTLESNRGSITSGNLNSSGTTLGGEINVSASDRITSREINSSSSSGTGGKITLSSQTAEITTNNLNSFGASNGGDIQVDADTQITAGQINSSGTIGKGGNVTLNSPDDIQVAHINAQGGTNGGTVDISTEQFFRATDTFSALNGLNASISTIGGSSGGSITIEHGGNGVIPFDVGNATTNGTAGAIASKNFQITPLQSFLFTYRQDNIQIISVDEPITRRPNQPNQPNQPSVNPVDLTTPQSQPHSPSIQNQNNESQKLDQSIQAIDESMSNDFEQYFGLSHTSGVTLTETRNTLRRVEKATGIKSAVIYALFVPETITPASVSALGLDEASAELLLLRSLVAQDSDRLELLLLTADGKPIRKSLKATRAQVRSLTKEFRRTVTNVQSSRRYFTPARQMYRLLLAPLEQDLKQQGIQNLVYITDTGLRTIPLAALHDGNQFIVERYSVSVMPSLALTDTSYSDIRNSQVLAMGASQFNNQRFLPAVPVELATITQIWPGKSFLNQDFTLDNLKLQRSKIPFGIIHLATHADFLPGKPTNSYIQLSDRKLPPLELRSLGWTKPSVDLLVLSACRTAVGNEEIELGFAGLALSAGVKSVLASLWAVNDEATLGLMSEFYQQLKDAPVKAEALRQVQLAMLTKKVRIEGGKLITNKAEYPLPPELIRLGYRDFSHPYYWSAFTIVGNPW